MLWQADLRRHRLGYQVVGIDFVLAKIIRDPQLVQDPNGIGLHPIALREQAAIRLTSRVNLVEWNHCLANLLRADRHGHSPVAGESVQPLAGVVSMATTGPGLPARFLRGSNAVRSSATVGAARVRRGLVSLPPRYACL